MRNLSHCAVLLLVVLAMPLLCAQDVIDRVVATVNGNVILQSDWDDAVRFEAFIEGRPLSQVTAEDRAHTLDRLIDQELVREQSQGSEAPQPSADEIRKKVQEIQSQHSATTPGSWQAALANYGIDEKRLQAHLAHDFSILRQVEARLRPTVQIDPQSVESYYRDEFLPKLRSAGAHEIPLAQVAAKIREILTQKRVNELFTSWVQNLRAGSKIRTPGIASSPSAAGGQGE